ncbi:hypothetical protein ABZ478_35385 [Streptomyces sp. NPDC005706]|uniref:hypothetical protein n=1 Tax=Streptomyces sp. NPDC005706 TaxID=3157169 RepID=UPI0033DD5BC4
MDVRLRRRSLLVLRTRHRAAGLAAITDLAFVGLDDGPDTDPALITGYKKPKDKKLAPAKKLLNQLTERAVCEHAFAHLKN